MALKKLTLPELSKGFDYEKTYNDCFVDLSVEIPRPPIALGIGYHNYKGIEYLNPTFTYGEMSAIVAPEKSKKTFFKAAMLSSYIGGSANNHFPSMKSCRDGSKYVIDFDTEQGPHYAQRAFRTVMDMVGGRYDNYLPFGIKLLSDDERVLFIDGVMNDKRFDGNIGFIAIDGIADLCMNTNDIEKSNAVIQKLIEWANKGAHVCNIIHKTFEKDKATGHLGTYVQKKSETVIFLNSTDIKVKNAPVLVEHKNSRGAPFDPFHFDLDLDTVLPKECNDTNWL